MKYENFDIEDFIADEFFVSWIRQDSKKANVFWQAWVVEHPEKLKTIQKAKEIILNIKPQRAKPTQKDYTEVLEGILSPNKISFSPNQDKERNNKGYFKYAAVVSILTLLLGWVVVFNNVPHINNNAELREAIMITKEVPFGQKSTIILSDGSKVKLNAGAKLIFPKTFAYSDTREVQLFGEAFFDVKRDTTKPFIVRNKEVTTKVLGTSFNIKEQEGNVDVSVVTGKVKVFSTIGNIAHNEVFLTPGKQAEYNAADSYFNVSNVNIDNVLAWKNDIIYFDKANFNEVAFQLEKWYGVAIKQQTKVEGKFSGRFKNQTLKEVLKGLSYTTDFNFKIEDETVFIY